MSQSNVLRCIGVFCFKVFRRLSSLQTTFLAWFPPASCFVHLPPLVAAFERAIRHSEMVLYAYSMRRQIYW
jgi:hypothetical protein